MSATVSVVIATHNYGRYLAGALSSVLAQTHSALEIVVIDDGSTDDTAAVVQPFLTDARVHYCRTERRGQPAAKNLGVRQSTAPLIAFLDADDEWLPTKVEKQLARFQADPELGLVYSRRLWMDEAGRPLQRPEQRLFRGNVLTPMFRNNFVCFSSAVVRRAAFAAAGGFDESLALAIDYDLWLRMARHGRFDYVDEPLVRYRTGHGNVSSRVAERGRTALAIMERFLDDHGGRHLLEPAHVRLCFAETYRNLALAHRSRSRLHALAWYVRSVWAKPNYRPAWLDLASLPLPEAARGTLRKVRGMLTGAGGA